MLTPEPRPIAQQNTAAPTTRRLPGRAILIGTGIAVAVALLIFLSLNSGDTQNSISPTGGVSALALAPAAFLAGMLLAALAGLLTTLEVALRKPRNSEEYRETLTDCRDLVKQMTLLVERLLTLTRLDARSDRLRTEPVDVAANSKETIDDSQMSMNIYDPNSRVLADDGAEVPCQTEIRSRWDPGGRFFGPNNPISPSSASAG